MKTLIEAAQEYAESQGYDTCDYVTKKDFEEYAKIDFYAGVEYAQRWIPVEEELPEIPENDYGSKKVLAKTNFGRLDLLRYTRYNGWQVLILNGETVTHWRPIEIE